MAKNFTYGSGEIRKMITIRLFPYQIENLKAQARNYHVPMQRLLEILIDAANNQEKEIQIILGKWWEQQDKKKQRKAGLLGLDKAENEKLLDLFEATEPEI